jgi:hypothetical protein
LGNENNKTEYGNLSDPAMPNFFIPFESDALIFLKTLLAGVRRQLLRHRPLPMCGARIGFSSCVAGACWSSNAAANEQRGKEVATEFLACGKRAVSLLI